MKACPECRHDAAEDATTCLHCGAPLPAEEKPQGRGFEYKSKATLWGLPWLHISFKYRGWVPIPAKGVIAIGQLACGVVAVAQFGLGLICVAQVAIAGYALAQVAAAYSLTAQVGIYVGEGHGSVVTSVADLIPSGPSAEELQAAEVAPPAGDGWKVSTPAEQGLDPTLVAQLYHDAARSEKLYALLVIKNGHLIAEGYFNEGAVDRKNLLQSATKSYTSALVGIALEQGHLSSVDQKMMEFFPEFADQISDPRKKEITIREMLQMRGGYPWEETDPAFWDALLSGTYLSRIVEIPLTRDPGTAFQYSNLTSNWLGIIVARACGTDLKSFAEEHLFSPIGAEVGDWTKDADGYHIGCGELHFTARDMAKFGLLYLNDGEFEGEQVVPADWVRESLQTYSENADSGGPRSGKVGRYFRDIGYGYQWWSARVGDHRFNYAAGHGGQLIVLLDELDMVVVTTSDPFYQQHDGESWKHETATFNLVGSFIESLPSG